MKCIVVRNTRENLCFLSLFPTVCCHREKAARMSDAMWEIAQHWYVIGFLPQQRAEERSRERANRSEDVYQRSWPLSPFLSDSFKLLCSVSCLSVCFSSSSSLSPASAAALKKVLNYWHWLNPVPAPCVSPPAKTEHEMKGSRWLCPLREINTHTLPFHRLPYVH